MLGDLIGESRGKRIVRRVLSSDPLKVEVSFEETGKMMGIDLTGFGTYWSEMQSNGILYGEGQGASITRDGDMISWKGQGVGQIKAGGAVSYRGSLYYRTASQKLAALNTLVGVFEYDVDADGNTLSKVWAWK